MHNHLLPFAIIRPGIWEHNHTIKRFYERRSIVRSGQDNFALTGSMAQTGYEKDTQ